MKQAIKDRIQEKVEYQTREITKFYGLTRIQMMKLYNSEVWRDKDAAYTEAYESLEMYVEDYDELEENDNFKRLVRLVDIVNLVEGCDERDTYWAVIDITGPLS